MPEKYIHLSWGSAGAPWVHAYVSDWSLIDQAIDEVFREGGEMKLATVHKLQDGESWQLLEFISVGGLPGKYRLGVFPLRNLGEAANSRTWWGEGKFRGKQTLERDGLWDVRTFCSDVQVAKALLAEFFHSRGVSPRIIAATKADSDPTPP